MAEAQVERVKLLSEEIRFVELTKSFSKEFIRW